MEASTKEENNCIIRGLKRSSLPFSERSLSRLSDEGFSFVMASTESTAQTLGAIIYHLADNPDILAELRKQLTDTQDSWSALEELPYLVGSLFFVHVDEPVKTKVLILPHSVISSWKLCV